MRNKKGFTLVEVLAVMILLIMLLLIAFPNFAGLSKDSKNKYDNTVNVLLTSAAKMYVNNHIEEVDAYLQTHNEYHITIKNLIDSEYLDSDIKSSKGTAISKDSYVTVKKTTTGGITEYIYTPPQLSN